MRELAAADSEQLADDLVLLVNGVYVTATVLGHQGPARRAGELARGLVRAACDESGQS
ncbi:hypothetical protein [Nocardia macrotermitis]|uniref:TetR family transcriptional regulator n=1 Tax=Nocardia macrotermitis TaxID=2585198 RepID=A0A7K0DB99_9NOCA|nr:hypothetical protein [Nocardia macrotermitis]MQY22144.1 hypothetical protein [Nocardia macrotermitis]